MKAIILAAGKGKRLNGIIGDDPKCLLQINGISLIERQISALRDLGIFDINVVVGYQAERVRRICGDDVRYTINEIYDATNSLYSLWLTRRELADGFVVMNSDVFFHPQLLTDLITTQYENALLVSYDSGPALTLGDEEMKVKIRKGLVTDISKTMSPMEADGENVGVVKFGAAGAKRLTKQMDKLIEEGTKREWAPRAFCEFARTGELHAVGTRGLPWIEIDFPEDYERAVNVIAPLIEAVGAGVTSDAEDLLQKI